MTDTTDAMVAMLRATHTLMANATDEEPGELCAACLTEPVGTKPVFLNSAGRHVCGGCWGIERELAGERLLMPWEMGWLP